MSSAPDAELPVAEWRIELLADCPKCGDYVDVLDSTGFPSSDGLQVCEKAEGLDVKCPTCEHAFKVNCSW